MKDIKEIAKEYTREDFLNEAAKSGSLFLCPRYSGLNQKCLSIVYDEKKCKECWREAVKDITFKSEEFTAICINDKTERDRKIKVLGITEGKEYPVKLCRYPNYYELVNDLGNVETYFMDRFEIVKNKKSWMQEAMEQAAEIIRDSAKEAFKIKLDGDKMENKIIRVRCINTLNFKDLTKDKEYPVIEEEPQGYKIINDDESIRRYHKSLFEKVEDVLMVECIANKKYVYDNITIGKEYEVLEKGEKTYKIINNNDDEAYYMKDCFKPVDPQKEVKEYTVMELLDFPVGTIFKYDDGKVKIIEYEKGNKGTEIIGISRGIELSTNWTKTKFTLIEEPKPVTTAEAFKALDEGKEIESVISKDKYKKINGTIYI